MLTGALGCGKRGGEDGEVKMHHSAKPVVIRGEWYPSATQAAKAIGVSVPAVINAKKRGSLDMVGLGARAGKPRASGVPVTIRGVKYSSMKDAADALGLCRSTISSAQRSGQLDKAGLGTGSNMAKPVMANFLEFPTISSAAEHLGVTQLEIRGAIKFKAPGFFFIETNKE